MRLLDRQRVGLGDEAACGVFKVYVRPRTMARRFCLRVVFMIWLC